MTALFLLLLSIAGTSIMAVELRRAVRPIRQQGFPVLGGRIGRVGGATVQVDSDFPASSLRFYRPDGYFIGGEPMEEDFMSVLVRSDCTARQLARARQLPAISFRRNVDSGAFEYISVKAAPITIIEEQQQSIDVDDTSFLEVSTYNGRWDYTSYWCSVGYKDSAKSAKKKVPKSALNNTSSDHDRALASSSSSSISHASDSSRHGLDTGSMNGEQHQRRELQSPTKICRINVEILHAGCRESPLQVNAPFRRYGNSQFENYNSIQDSEDECLTHYREDMSFPDDVFTTLGEDEAMPQIPQESCTYYVEGRPFVDAYGQTIMASAFHSERIRDDGWCAAPAGSDGISPLQNTISVEAIANENTASSNNEESGTSYNNDDDNNNNKGLRANLGREWTRRALGEHSSIASFAAFTIALMSNHAPPQLIRDSLVAASDEVRHAKVSFEAATRFTGRPVEPGPLPPSTHQFGHNATALALATAKEGCIDETLSALLASIEVDYSQQHWGWLPKDEQVWLEETMKTIATEEASHSGLAWRTIQWVCTQDHSACEAVKEQVLAIPNLKQAVQNRFKDRGVDEKEVAEKAWSYIYKALLPLLVTTEDNAKANGNIDLDLILAPVDGLPPLTEQVVRKMVQVVFGTLHVTAN